MAVEIPNNLEVVFSLHTRDYEMINNSGMLAMSEEKDPHFKVLDYASAINALDEEGKLSDEVMRKYSEQVMINCSAFTGKFVANTLGAYGRSLSDEDAQRRMYNISDSIMQQIAVQAVDAQGEDPDDYDFTDFKPFTS